MDAQAAGAGMIMIHQPVHPYMSVDGWVEYHRAIASHVPELAVVLYVRNDAIPGSAFARLGEHCPNVIGVKYAVHNPVRLGAVAADAGAGRFTWVAGLAELSAPGYFAAGATGFTSGLANVDPATSLRLWHALDGNDHDEVRRIWNRVRPFEELRAVEGSAYNVSVVKEALCQLGSALGTRTTEAATATRDAGQGHRPARAMGSSRTTRLSRWISEASDGSRSVTALGRSVTVLCTCESGIGSSEHAGKPVIGILNTWSDINPCHMTPEENVPQAVKRGVWQAGGSPGATRGNASENVPEADTDALPEPLPMETEEDNFAVLPARRGGALWAAATTRCLCFSMGAARRPSREYSSQPARCCSGHLHGETVGSGTDMWRFWNEKRAGTISEAEWDTPRVSHWRALRVTA